MIRSLCSLILCYLFSFLLFCETIKAQSITAGFNCGIGTYAMTTLKELQQFRLEYSGLPARETENFPPFWTGGIEFGLEFPRFPSRITWFYQYASTGARVNAMDYSGELTLDLVANCNQLGTNLGYDFFSHKFFSIGAGLKISYLTTEVKMTDYFQINGQSQSEQYRFISRGGGVEPGISAGFRVAFFRFGLYGGYLFGFSEGLRLPGTPKVYLKLPTDENASPDWSGFRAAITVNVVLPLKKKRSRENG